MERSRGDRLAAIAGNIRELERHEAFLTRFLAAGEAVVADARGDPERSSEPDWRGTESRAVASIAELDQWLAETRGALAKCWEAHARVMGEPGPSSGGGHHA